ncbi:hypothetical protein VSH64_36685 [Amycolatopsis rhabdoformis]|uniref:WD40 repeat domain-containing protein n=1 Tax=Amycolatopsis rhabdoformis TaxID=1448059 RepID=A0ABZ1I1R6_9PSEU|nr:hypothetical protein [Amycolatopsis rhabdoformis]WSE28335.1 hypothetical protein VSH64_36685 [Amycolatopsis rhabdoformis]
MQLLLATSPPTVFDADTGVKGTVSGVPGGDRLVSLQRVGHTPVILTSPPCQRTCQPFDVYAGTTAVPLGQAVSLAPGADADSVWVIRQDAPDSCRLEHVSLAGKTLGGGSVASCSTNLREETSHGLLITVNNGTAETVDVLIDPDTGRTVQQAPSILAAIGDRLILGGLTDLTVVDLRDGSRKKIQPPVVQSSPVIVPSREGGFAAVDFGSPAWHSTDIQTRDVWLLDLGDLTWQQAPSMPYSTGTLKHSSLDWTDHGDLVLDDGVVAAWHPGEPAWRLGKAKLTGALQTAAVSVS